MPNFDIEIDEILWNCSSYEKQELADALYDDGYPPKQIKGTLADIDEDDEWNDAVAKLKNNQWRLSKEDEETILKITNKII